MTTVNMNAYNTTPSYMTPGHPQHVSYGQPPPTSESRIDKAYVTSIRGILKFACLLFSFIAFICVTSTSQCNGNHAFLASVTWLVIIMQVIIIIVFLFRLKTRFTGIDFELLIASSVTIHYCRIPGQVAGGVMGIFAFIFLAADAVTIFLARRDEPAPNINNNDIR
ncbi:unnamed protein product [Rotaria sp. Silwood1]|nr:unnamed protein product [Rotaria sp. Silwood1]